MNRYAYVSENFGVDTVQGLMGGLTPNLARRAIVDTPQFDYELFLAGYEADYPADGFLGGDMGTVVLRPKEGAVPGFPGFYGWLAATHPDIYDYLRVSVPDYDVEGRRTGGSELGLIDPQSGETSGTPQPSPGIASQIVATVTQAAAALLPLYQQQQLLRIQLQRAQDGKPPLDTSQYESATAGVQVGVNRSTQNTLLWAVGILGAVFLLPKLLKR